MGVHAALNADSGTLTNSRVVSANARSEHMLDMGIPIN